MAVTRDGRSALAIVAHGSATRRGLPFQLLRWRLADPADRVAVGLGPSLDPPLSICAALDDREKAAMDTNGSGIGVTTADIAGCSDKARAPSLGWRIDASDRQAIVFAPSGAAVARIDHAAKVLQAALSPDAGEAVTLDERGHVQRFAVEPKELIAQACRRQPQALTEDLRASLPVQVRAVDACGRKAGSEATAEAKT